jgi:hypothetical protein
VSLSVKLRGAEVRSCFGEPMHVEAEAPKSGPIDKSLGRKADPVGGKIYDKGSAWAGAQQRRKEN